MRIPPKVYLVLDAYGSTWMRTSLAAARRDVVYVGDTIVTYVREPSAKRKAKR
jgi:hypothetical protein